MSIMPRTAGTNPLEKFFRDADAYARSIDFLPLEWWPSCIDEGLGVPRRQMKVQVHLVSAGNPARYDAVLKIETPMAMGTVELRQSVDRELDVRSSVDEALAMMKGSFTDALLEKIMPGLSAYLIIWDERKHHER